MGNMRVNLDSWSRYAARPGNDTKQGNVAFLLGCLEEAYADMDFAINVLDGMILSDPQKVRRNKKLERVISVLREPDFEKWDGV